MTKSRQERLEARKKAYCTVSLMGLVVSKLPDTPRLSTLLATVACRVRCTGALASKTTAYWLVFAAGEMRTLKGTQTLTALNAGSVVVCGAARAMEGSVAMPQMAAMAGMRASRAMPAMDESRPQDTSKIRG